MFKTEMHCHCHPASACSQVAAPAMVEDYVNAGYTTMVLTDHLNDQTFSPELEKDTWQKRVDYFVSGYNRLKEVAKGRIHVLFGSEIRLLNDPFSDYLVYGISEAFLRSVDDPRYLHSSPDLAALVHEHGLMIFQAHPFRENMLIPDPAFLDGMEIGNLCYYKESNNDMAQMWAERKGMTGITGTDYHIRTAVPVGGIATEYPITDNEILLKTLREKTFTPLWG
ncbi:MAG: PHP domain-containing protein [Ruminococcaceae bacterium]|nr:PHP domain-containing protein [Oscillospiraceae bacterium]